jgi:acyl-homoserine-lactone acylase
MLIGGCATAAPDREVDRYDVEIVRTEFGIPHVTAADYRSLGYGLGYAYAQDNFCMLADKILQLNGERARHFGPDDPAHIAVNGQVSTRVSDFFHRSQYDKRKLADAQHLRSPAAAELTVGYAAGVNRYLQETGATGLPEPCRGAAWVRPLTAGDLHLWYTAVATLSASQRFAEGIVAAQPPRAGTVGPSPGAQAAAPLDLAAVGGALAEAPAGGIGSNAWAFGREATANGRGLLFGNPHWSWGNMNRFYQAHLTVPGQLDVMGVTYGGMPVVILGFNRSLAWSHTVSTGARFVVRELKLAGDSPLVYVVDGERREMQESTITIDVLGADGTARQESRTFYTTEFGPIIVQEHMPWTTTTAYALTDLNLPNQRLVEQWLDVGRARDVGSLRETLETVMGIPWVNTLAADADGATLYADYSVKPYVSDERMKACAGSEAARRATQAGVLTLDGSTRSCDPDSDPSLPQPGILPPRLLPVLERSDYVANSNNSYWLTNPAQPITGLPIINGATETFIGYRPQSGLRIIEARLAGRDGLPGDRFDAQAVKALVFGHTAHPNLGNHNRAAEVMLEGLTAVCRREPAVSAANNAINDLSEACRVLAGWDGRHDTGSVGAHLFREFWSSASRVPKLMATPFDPLDPLRTPRSPNVTDPEVLSALRQALEEAVLTLIRLEVPLDRRWGEVHTHPLGGRQIPIPGNDRDVLNLMSAGPLTPGGYGPIVLGSSYVQIVGFDSEGPVADAVLLYGQSSNPASAFHYDQLQALWARREWNRLPFNRSDVTARAISRVRLRE